MYRLDFVIASTDASGAPKRGTYTINLEDQDSGELHVGANVSLAPNGSGRQDVGIKIRCGLVSQGNDLVVHGDTEISASAGDSSIHKIHVRGVSLVQPGTPALIASLDEPSTHAHYDVSVTATRLN